MAHEGAVVHERAVAHGMRVLLRAVVHEGTVVHMREGEHWV